MSSMPELSPEQAEELFQLYARAINAVGMTPKEAHTLQAELRERLQAIWNAETRPMPYVFDDFRRTVIQAVMTS
jgi:type II secretory pathway predicted ATPase ExeA